MYEVMNMALPKKGFNGVEKNAEMAACRNNIAESNCNVKDDKLESMSPIN